MLRVLFLTLIRLQLEGIGQLGSRQLGEIAPLGAPPM